MSYRRQLPTPPRQPRRGGAARRHRSDLALRMAPLGSVDACTRSLWTSGRTSPSTRPSRKRLRLTTDEHSTASVFDDLASFAFPVRDSRRRPRGSGGTSPRARRWHRAAAEAACAAQAIAVAGRKKGRRLNTRCEGKRIEERQRAPYGRARTGTGAQVVVQLFGADAG